MKVREVGEFIRSQRRSAGVSVRTVSNVVNGFVHVSPQMRVRDQVGTKWRRVLGVWATFALELHSGRRVVLKRSLNRGSDNSTEPGIRRG